MSEININLAEKPRSAARFNPTGAITAVGLLMPVVAALFPLAAAAEEAWNGLVKTDTDSIGATRDVSQSKVIPAPELPFGGVINRNVYDSTAWWPPSPAPKKGARNVLLVLIDDEGFGAPSTYPFALGAASLVATAFASLPPGQPPFRWHGMRKGSRLLLKRLLILWASPPCAILFALSYKLLSANQNGRAGTLPSHECDGDSYACLTLSNEKTT